MRKAILLLTGVALLSACTGSEKNSTVKAESTVIKNSPNSSKTITVPVSNQKCEPGERLIFEKDLKSYTEDKMRGSGVISLEMDVNDRSALNAVAY